jgi:hypothetical protein
MLNPSEVFGDIMIDYSYVECSSACITAFKVSVSVCLAEYVFALCVYVYVCGCMCVYTMFETTCALAVSAF